MHFSLLVVLVCLCIAAYAVNHVVLVENLTQCIFSSGLVGSRVCALQGIFVFLGVQILPLRDQSLT